MNTHIFEQEPTEDDLAPRGYEEELPEDILEAAEIIASVDRFERTTLPILRNIETGEYYSRSSDLDVDVADRVTSYFRTANTMRPYNHLHQLIITDDAMTPEPMRTSFFSSRISNAASASHASTGDSHRSAAEEVTERVLALCQPFSPGMTLFKNTKGEARNNQTTLADIGFSEAMLDSKAKKERYRDFCCLISTYIMTDPVHAPDYPQFHFEKSEILKWLRIKQEHPFNRTSLMPEQLVPSVALKQEINQFVDDTVANFHPMKNGTPFSNR